MDGLTGALSRVRAVREAAGRLAAAGIDGAAAEARHLGLHCLGLTPTDLALRPETPIGGAGAAAFEAALRRRLAGEPVARILGEWEFHGLTFALTPGTLVPRPDTETLVETALALAADLPARPRILDLGTGSGCILIALLHAWPGASGVGTDRSTDALATARANAVRNGVADRAAFLCGSWCAPLGAPFDLVVSNPPYIARGVIPTLAPEVRLHDPPAALDGGEDGLDAYRAILAALSERPALLAPGGAVALEIGYDQAEAVLGLARGAGFARTALARDLAGHDRVVTLRPRSSRRKTSNTAADNGATWKKPLVARAISD